MRIPGRECSFDKMVCDSGAQVCGTREEMFISGTHKHVWHVLYIRSGYGCRESSRPCVLVTGSAILSFELVTFWVRIQVLYKNSKCIWYIIIIIYQFLILVLVFLPFWNDYCFTIFSTRLRCTKILILKVNFLFIVSVTYLYILKLVAHSPRTIVKYNLTNRNVGKIFVEFLP